MIFRPSLPRPVPQERLGRQARPGGDSLAIPSRVLPASLSWPRSCLFSAAASPVNLLLTFRRSTSPAGAPEEEHISCSHLHRYCPCCAPASAPGAAIPTAGSPPASSARRAPDPAPASAGAAGRGGAGRPRRGSSGRRSGVSGDEGDAGLRGRGSAGDGGVRGVAAQWRWGPGACGV